MNKRYSKFLLLFFSITLLVMPLFVMASVELGLDDVNLGLGETDLKSIITNIIRVVLGFLGIIAVGFIIYAGFTWMTAGGVAEKIDKAKKILIRASIGLVIILSAFAIASFVINTIGGATGLGDGSGPGTGPSIGTDPSGTNLVVSNWQPYDGATGTARNIMARVYFNRTIDAGSVEVGDFSFTRLPDSSAVSFDFDVNGSRIDIHPLVACEVEGVEYCLDSIIEYRVEVVVGSITSVDGKDLICISGCSTTFTTSDYIDLLAPTVSLIDPHENDTFPVTAVVDILAQADDDSGVVAAMTFFADNVEVLPTGSDGAEPWEGSYAIAGYDEGDRIEMKATAEDLSGNVGSSGDTTIRILPDHCFNQTQDEDETGIDCGGSCGGCLGDSCDDDVSTEMCEPSDSLCGQGVCNLDCICALAPIIYNISPDNGAVGNYITITGDGFGSSAGSIVFLGSNVAGDEISADLADCAVAWSPSQVIVEVPAGVVSGGIKLITNGGDFDTTLDDHGWQGDFILNTTTRPGICGVSPEAGTALSNINIIGTQFGDTIDTIIVGGIDVNAVDIDFWSNSNITALVPNLSFGKVSVAVDVDGEISNPVQFEVVRDVLIPFISYLEPDHGPIGQYITIHGENFGFDKADILVNFISGGITIPADIDFPAMCGEYSIGNNEILVKVPDGASLGLWDVVVVRDLKNSDPVGFDVTDNVLAPGFCLLEPDNGPVSTMVDAYGEGFGATGQFTFYNNLNASIDGWSDGHISSQVPINTNTGPVKATSADGGISNSINFSVGSCDANSCSSSDECCSDGICRVIGNCEQSIGAEEYVWTFTTGQQLPPFIVEDVWPICDDACINTMIGVEFSNPVDVASLNDMSIDVKQCTDEDCTAFVNEIEYTTNEVPVGYYDATNYILAINPDGNLEAELYYRVVLRSGSLGIVNEEGGYLENISYASTGGEIDSYSWIFKTGIDECTLDRVEVLPEDYTIYSQDELLNMTSYPFSEPDACSPRGQMLDPADFTWEWQSTSVATATVVGTGYQSVVTPVWGHPGETSIVAMGDGVLGSSLVTVDMDIPRIDSISPDNGMINENLKTYVTIHGANFGDTQGSTLILVGGEEVSIADCDAAWSDTQIVVEMPASTQTGDTIQIIKTGGDDESNPFTVNSIIRPALCSIDPVYGTDNTSVTLTGYNFGDTQNDGMVFFDQIGVNTINSWSNTMIKTRVPNGTGTGPVVVNILGNDSNSVIFSMEPYITSLQPDNGSVNSYTTINGGNFGEDQGDGYVMMGNQRAYLAPCSNSWGNTKIIIQVPEGLSLGNKDVQVVTHYGIPSNTVDYDVNEKPLNPLLCELDPEWAAVNEIVELHGDNFGDAPYLADQVEVDSKLGANYADDSEGTCMGNNGSYVNSCNGFWVEYEFNFTNDGYYNAWAETENYSMDLTDQGIYHNVSVYIDGEAIGYFSNPASTPNHQIGSVGLGWVSAGVHTVRYRWTNDWCGGCNGGVGDSNIRIHNVGINSGAPMSYPLFTNDIIAEASVWSNNEVSTFITDDIQSGPVLLTTKVVVGQRCAGFHIGNWCPGGEYEDIIETVESNSVDFMRGCVIGTTSSRDSDFIPIVAENSEAVGALATDGKFIYGKSWSDYDEQDYTISIIGTGYQGTIAGQDYGDLATVTRSIAMTYHVDGFLYNGYSVNGHNLERVDVVSGSVDTNISIPEGLLNRNTGEAFSEVRHDSLITSDGEYIYNLAFSRQACPENHGSRCYDGFKVRVFDPMNNWEMVREWTSGTTSFYTDGIIADGKYIYAIEWSGQNKIRKMDAVTGEFIAEWISEQGNGGNDGSGNDIISGQYDWVNDRVWLGDLVNHERSPGPAYLYRYNSCHNEDININNRPVVVESETCENNAIQSPSPYINTNEVCVGARISASFNKIIEKSNIIDGVEIYTCVDVDNCTLGTDLDLDSIIMFNPTPESTGFIINNEDSLSANTSYKINLTADIVDIHGMSLIPYEWSFNTGDEDCIVDSIAVTPVDTTMNVNDSVIYSALPLNDSCEILSLDIYSYDWLSSNENIVTVGNTNLGVNSAVGVDGGSCDILASIDSIEGSTSLTIAFPPNCGDGILQTLEGEQCDDGNTTSGDGCSTSCQLEITTGGVCGDSIVQWPNSDYRYEQCDDGNTSPGDGCSNICYLENGNYFGNCPSCDEGALESQVAWWDMNEGDGEIVSNSINILNDGAFVNKDDESWSVGRIGNSSLYFNGANQYVDVLDVNDNLNFDNAFTVSAWINADEFYQEYSIATLKYGGDEGNESRLASTITGIDDYINISSSQNYGHLDANGDHYNTVESIPDSIYDYDIIIWDHSVIDLDVSRLDRNKPAFMVVRENRYSNYTGEQLSQYDWPVVGYQGVWTTHTTMIKRSDVANNVFIISSDGTNTHTDIWCTWEHYSELVGQHLGSLISVLSGQVVAKGGAYGLYMDNNELKGYVNFTGTLDNTNNIVSTEILDGWNYIAMTYDDSQLQLYLNGSVVDNISFSGAVIDNDEKLLIGQFYVGAIDDVKLYDEARIAEDIYNSYLDCTTQCSSDLPDELCGNGVVDGTEQCDDGNIISGDGCSALCVIEESSLVCGNYSLDIGEECDFDIDGEPMFDGETCDSQGDYLGGILGCLADSCVITTDECVPGDPTGNVCINTEISAEFDALMNWSTFIAGTTIYFEKITNTCETGSYIGTPCSNDGDCVDGFCDVDIDIAVGLEDIPPNDSEYTKLYIYPSAGNLEADTDYRVTVAGGVDGVQDVEGHILSADYSWPFFTGDSQCFIERVEITPSSYQFSNSDEIVNFTVHGYDGNNNTVVGEYSWEIQGDEQLATVVGGNSQTIQVSATGIGNGELSLRAEVYASEDSYGSDDVPIDIFMCNIPWIYENEDFNFKTRYCRGEGVNHIYNSGFEMDDNGDDVPDVWSEPVMYHEGSILNGYNWDFYQSDILLKPNTTYTISAHASQSAEGNNTEARMVVKTCDTSGDCSDSSVAAGVAEIGTCELGHGGHPQDIDLLFYPTDMNMERISCWFRTNEFVVAGKIYLLTNGDGDGPVWFNNVQLELGAEASTYEESNLLPSLSISPDSGTGDEMLNILLLQSDYNISDAIGLRVFTNFDHVSPSVWYQENIENIGTPTIVDVGGYSGLQEGRTTYVNAANKEGDEIYTNMFVMSYTQGANSMTQDIFSQMYNNWTFNSNMESTTYKQMLVNDTQRLEDMMTIKVKLGDYYHTNLDYPELMVGTYYAGTTVSAWDSWQNVLGVELGGVPVDPINLHVDCSNGFDPVTCWNPDQLDYYCPINSHVYRYDYVNAEYYVYSNFEYDGVTWMGTDELSIEPNAACDNVILNEDGIISIEGSNNPR
jgi:cysteine-rich repeat protein